MSQSSSQSRYVGERAPGDTKNGRLSAPRDYLSRRVVRSVLALGFISLLIVPTAGAWTNVCSADLDIATCERVQYLADNLPQTTDRLDLIWQGIWFMSGIVFVLMIAPLFTQAFRFWRS